MIETMQHIPLNPTNNHDHGTHKTEVILHKSTLAIVSVYIIMLLLCS